MHTISQLRKLLYISLTFLFYSSTILAQQTSVEGLVYFHGSRGNGNKIRPVSNVKISTLNNKAAYSDQKGRFKLSLKNVSLDEPIFIKIEKKGYEVIDQNNLQYFHLDQKDKLRIFLAKKGYIKTQRSKFLQSAKAAHIEEKERLLDLLAFGGTAEKAALKTIGNRTGMKMYSAYDAEQLLLQMSGDLEELQSDYALELTYINPDFASKLFKDAMNAFLENDPEETVALLREEEQEKSFLELLNQIEKGKDDSIAIKRIIEKRGRLLEQIKNNYVLQIISMHQYFYFKEANNALKKLATINRYMPTHKHTELIKKFDLYKIIEPSTPEVNLAAVNKEVENNTPPSPLQSNEPTTPTETYSTIPLKELWEKEAAEKKMESKGDDPQPTTDDNTSIASDTKVDNDAPVLNSKENQTNSKNTITKIEQLDKNLPVEIKRTKTDSLLLAPPTKSMSLASVNDFENILFATKNASSNLIGFLQQEKESHGTTMVEQPKVTLSTKPTVQRKPLIKKSEPVVIVENRPKPTTTVTPPPVVIEKKPTRKVVQTYTITKRTSLRQRATAKSKVLKRLAVGTQLEYLQKIDQYWYKVRWNGKVGYVKSFLLERVN